MDDIVNESDSLGSEANENLNSENKESEPAENNPVNTDEKSSAPSLLKAIEFLKKQDKQKLLFSVIALLILIIVILVIVISCSSSKNKKKKGEEFGFHSEVKLKEIAVQIRETLDMSTLSAMELPNRGIAEWYDGKTFVGYVQYEGSVTLGIDFSNIAVTIDDSNNSILVKVPKVDILTIETDKTKIKTVYADKKTNKEYNVDKYTDDKYLACKEDLKKVCSRENNEKLYQNAQENINKLVESLTKPIAEANNYNLVVSD